jgi:hypothetical protein
MSAVETATDGNKPAVLFNIDGTVLLSTIPPPEGYEHYPVRPKMPVSIESYSPEHPKWIKHLLKQDVEVAYISIWLQESHQYYGEQLGLPELSHVPLDDFGPFQSNSTKTKAIDALYGRRPVAMFDDKMNKDTLEWAKARSDLGSPTFLCKPDSRFGIQPENIEAANRWLGGLGLSNIT